MLISIACKQPLRQRKPTQNFKSPIFYASQDKNCPPNARKPHFFQQAERKKVGFYSVRVLLIKKALASRPSSTCAAVSAFPFVQEPHNIYLSYAQHRLPLLLYFKRNKIKDDGVISERINLPCFFMTNEAQCFVRQRFEFFLNLDLRLTSSDSVLSFSQSGLDSTHFSRQCFEFFPIYT